jgi:pimeloyl-ACP methyl ester carboxylesterase
MNNVLSIAYCVLRDFSFSILNTQYAIRLYKLLLFSFLIVALFAPVISAETSEELQLKTSDGVELYAIYKKVPDEKATLILLPMLSKTKVSWKNMQDYLAENKYSSVAVDLRGHGDSISKNGREISWRTFSGKEFRKMVTDVETVYKFLTKKEKVILKISILWALASERIPP